MKNLTQPHNPIGGILEEFESLQDIAPRFNPKEPIYGEANRREMVNIKVWLKSKLHEVREAGRVAGVKEAIKQPNQNSCHYRGVCEHCAVEEFKSSLTKLITK